jgi:uncharacterized protein (DUF4415 family)
MKKLNKLSRKQLQNLEKLAALPDSEIDIRDIPPWSGADFARSVPLSSLYKPRKMQVTTRIDSDVVEWLKHGERHYQSRLNRILRIAMMAATKKPAKVGASQSSRRPTVATAKRVKRKKRRLARAVEPRNASVRGR